MNDLSNSARIRSTPAEFVARLEASAVRRTTTDGGVDVVWRTWGRGEPLVLLHGGTGSWMHWIKNIEALSGKFTLLVPDLPGSGESGTPAPPISAEGIAVILRLGLSAIIGADTKFALAGFSMGGLIAGYLASQSAGRVERLVLVGSSGMEGTRAPMAPLVSWRRLRGEEERNAVHRKNLGILMIHDPLEIDDLAVHVQSRNAEQSRVRGKHVSHTGALSRCLPGYSGRLAGIWGEFDPTAAPYLAERRERLRQFRPDASFDIFPGAGHWVQYEAHEAFNRRIVEILAAAS